MNIIDIICTDLFWGLTLLFWCVCPFPIPHSLVHKVNSLTVGQRHSPTLFVFDILDLLCMHFRIKFPISTKTFLVTWFSDSFWVYGWTLMSSADKAIIVPLPVCISLFPFCALCYWKWVMRGTFCPCTFPWQRSFEFVTIHYEFSCNCSAFFI